MQITNVNLQGNLLQDFDLSLFKVGQRFEVEIINNNSQEGLISLGGRIIGAKLEAQVQNGDKFWAVVKDIDKNGIVLSKENTPAAKIDYLSPEEELVLTNRGFGFDSKIAEYLVKFNNLADVSKLPILTSENSELSDLVIFLKTIIPSLPKIDQSGNSILQYFHELGLNYENLILKLSKNNKEQLKFDPPSVKMELLKLLSEDGKSMSRENIQLLTNFLEEITGQQLWLQTGTNNNAYFLMNFPLQDNGVYYNARIAVESQRKGTKIDLNHCHFALQVDTPNLGKIGADLLIYENSISISILYDNIEEIKPILEELKNETTESFSVLGLKLQNISLKSFEDNQQFIKFITGKQLGGVDVKG